MNVIDYLPLATILFAWALLTLYVFIRAPNVATLVKLLVVPLVIVAAILSYRVTDLNAGYPKHTFKLPERFLYLGHKVIINDYYEKIGIDVWAQNGHITRLYAIPWSKAMEEALNKAQGKKMGAKGRGDVEMKGKPGKKGGKPGEESDQAPYDSELKLPNYNQTKPDYLV